MTANEALSLLLEAVEDDESRGFCLACGADAYGVEPDGREYECEDCGEHRVYGAEELLIMGAAGALAKVRTRGPDLAAG